MRIRMAVAALALAASPASAQSGSGEILVTGKKPEQLREEARSFIRSVSATPVSGQFARWRDPVCVKTIGLAEDHASIVTNKILQIARSSGVRVAKAKCVTNLLVIFTDDADRDLAALRKSGSVMSKSDPIERRMLQEPRRVARWWYATSIEGKHGNKPSGTPAALIGANIPGAPGGLAMISNGETVGVDGYSSSLVGTHIRAKIEQATFIVDANAATGHKLRSVAAYAALVTLARIRMNGADGAEDSILALFSGAPEVQDDLTTRDKAFLAALYQVPANRSARQQEGQIAMAMSKILMSQD